MKRLKNRSGETIVEVIVSAMIFLMLMGVLQGAITFSGRAIDKSRRIRESNADMFEALAKPDTPAEDLGTETYHFYAYNTDETHKGNRVFGIEADLRRKNVTYTTSDGEEAIAHFYLFGGGEAP